MSLLEVTGLNTYYGDSHILFDVSLTVERNEVVALLGRNGAGKSTTLKSLMGVAAPRVGSIIFDGAEMVGKKSHAIAQAGIQLVHEERRIFGSLNVEENLVLRRIDSGGPLAAGTGIRDVSASQGAPGKPRHRSFRRRTTDAGDRARLVRQPKILLLDEPFEGLAPVIVHDLLATCRALANAGQTILLVEQNITAAMTLADRVYILNNGHIVDSMTAEAVRHQPDMLHRHLGV